MTIRYQRGNQEAISSCKSKKNSQYNDHKIPKRQSVAVNRRRTTNTMDQDTKEAISSCKSKKNSQYNDHTIPNGQSVAVNRRRTANTMTIRYQRGNQ